MRVSYEVRVPPETEVSAASESGATTVSGTARAVVIRTQAGAIDVTQLGDTGVVTSGSGAVTVDGVAGSLTITTSSSMSPHVQSRAICGFGPRVVPSMRSFPENATWMSKLVPARFA